PSRPFEVRAAAQEAVLLKAPQLEPPLFRLLLDALSADAPPLQRLTAARILGQALLSNPQLVTLTGEVARAGPLVLPRLLPAFAREGPRQVGDALVDALDRSPGLRSLTPAQVSAAL